MPEVTDPGLLRQLNTGRAGTPGSTASSSEVTDPALLLRLNASRETAKAKPSGWIDFLRSIPGGLVGGVADTLAASGQAEAGLMGMEGVPGPEQTKKILEKVGFGRALPELQTFGGRVGASIGRAVTNPTTYLGPGGLPAKIASGVGGAVGSEIGGQVSKDSMAGRMIGGAAGAMVPAAAAGAARRIAAPTPMRAPERAGDVALLRREGIEPSAGDVSGRQGVRVAEEMGERVLGGGSYSELKDRPLRQLTAAVTERMGERVERATPEVIERARTRIGSVMERVATKLPITHDTRLTNDLTAIATEVTNNPWLHDELRSAVTRQIEAILNGFTTRIVKGTSRTQGVMDGATYQGLTRKNTPLGRAIDSNDTNVAHYAQRIRTVLDDALERSATARGTRAGTGRRQALADLKEARRQWYNMLVISKSVAGAGEAAAEGTILPDRLRAALTGTADNKMSYAAGRSDLHKLARAANSILTPARKLDWMERAKIHGIPSAVAGTIGMAAVGPGTAAMAATGAGLAPGLVGRAVNSRLGQRYLKRQRGPATPAYQWANALRGAAIGAETRKREPRYGGTDAE